MRVLDFVYIFNYKLLFSPRDGVRRWPIKSRDLFSTNENYFTLEFDIKIIYIK